VPDTMTMGSCSPETYLNPAEGYRVWASTYDREPNPMLSLETNILGPLLPALAGRDAIDLGCGTGRWLHYLKNAGARTLLGVDLSPEMLAQAKAKLSGSAAFLCADFNCIPIRNASADVVLCNFVLSYIDDAEDLIGFATSLLRPGSSFFLTDVHPETVATLNWQRGVHVQGRFQEIRTTNRSISEIVGFCHKAGLELKIQVEPKFGNQERAIFEQSGKGEYFDSVRDYPAIYVLQFTAPKSPRTLIGRAKTERAITRLHGARFALGPDKSVEGEIVIVDNRIDGLYSSFTPRPTSNTAKVALDLSGYLIFPGLINAHDHLEFALFPRLGKGHYLNFLEWAEDIHYSHSAEIARHRQVPKGIRLWWGGIRNLLSGVTTVCHHNPYDAGVFSNDFVVRVLRDYTWAHSVAFDVPGLAKKRAVSPLHPFLIHLAEGIDEQSSQEIFALQRDGALDERTVIIHGLGLDEKGTALLRSADAGLVWCPSSNLFLFGQSIPADKLAHFPKVALGSDSSLTANGDLLDEIRCAYRVQHAPAEQLYSYVTCQPAALLCLANGEGTLRVGAVADLIAVRDPGSSPAETLTTLTHHNIELVLIGGRVHLISPELNERLPFSACEGLQALCVDGTEKWIRAPLDRLFREARAHLGSDLYLGGKHVCLAD
jgi:cytosine/adenosine deaminase-related metal-dependent hydrolase/ubiquinone/menaquinone biosynthesis C-methylase UbiE